MSPAYCRLLSLSLALILSACASPPDPVASNMPVVDYLSEYHLQDKRGRFREIFCAVLSGHGNSLPDYRPCEEALRSLGDEGGATGQPVSLGLEQAPFLFLLVPGLGWECFSEWLDHDSSAPQHLASMGFKAAALTVDGLSSTAHNARQIRDAVMSLPADQAQLPIVLAGYSKGAPDILEALVAYPELQDKVVAVMSIAGAVGGSPLAEEATQEQANLLTHVPGAACDKGDAGAVASLVPALREAWLAENPLPERIRYYSVVTYPDESRISWGLQKSYYALSGVDARNDTQMLIQHQVIPGSQLLAFLNADHWAVAVPVARSHAFVGATFVNRNDYPREALLESLLRYLVEDLDL